MSRKVTGTTGRSPDDPLGKQGRAVAVPLLITMPELEELLDVSIADQILCKEGATMSTIAMGE